MKTFETLRNAQPDYPFSPQGTYGRLRLPPVYKFGGILTFFNIFFSFPFFNNFETFLLKLVLKNCLTFDADKSFKSFTWNIVIVRLELRLHTNKIFRSLHWVLVAHYSSDKTYVIFLDMFFFNQRFFSYREDFFIQK